MASDNLRVTKVFPNGAVTAMVTYDVDGVQQWTIVVFPSAEDAERFADDNNMDFSMTPEVQIHLNALREALNGG